VLWDRTDQYGRVTADGTALRSSGALYEFGLCYRLRFDHIGVEIGILPRLQLTGADNGVEYYSDAGFFQSSIPVRVSVPLSF
jgi:hypothetical protein